MIAPVATTTGGLVWPAEPIEGLDWSAISQATGHDPTYQALVASGLLLATGLVVHFCRALVALQRQQPADFFWPVVKVVVVAALLTHYRWLTEHVITLASTVGRNAFGGQNLEAMFEARRAAYARAIDATLPDWSPGASREQNVAVGMELLAYASLLANCAVLFCLRYGQAFLLTLLVLLGPWLLALDYVGGPFRGAGKVWLLALVETSLWSAGLRVLGAVLAPFDRGLRPAFVASQDLVRALVHIGLILAVPVVFRLVFSALAQSFARVAPPTFAASGVRGGT